MMGLEDTISRVDEKQKDYLVALALCIGDKAKASELSLISEEQLNSWRLDVNFLTAKDLLGTTNYTVEAVKVWVTTNLSRYLHAIHYLALTSRSHKVRFEALKYLIGLVGECKESADFTLIEKMLFVRQANIIYLLLVILIIYPMIKKE